VTDASVSLSRTVLFQYRRFTLYNSPFTAHDHGHAVDLYPDTDPVPSPVAGTVTNIRTVTAPPKPYAADHDYLLLVDTGPHVARIMHVEPTVEPGEMIAVGDPLGRSVRAGFFAPWVPNHLHLGFRPHDANPYRASGSLRIEPAVNPRGLAWDGTGTVIAAGDTWARLDRPAHPAPGEQFVGLAGGGGVLDGGFPHYNGGGVLGTTAASQADTVTVAGAAAGTAVGRDVTWHDCTVRANGTSVTGLALFSARDQIGAKLVGETVDLAVGDPVTVTVTRES
jgi:hypothetical protein